MQLRTRLVLMVAVSVSIGIAAVAGVLSFLAWRSIVAQAETEGVVIARLLAQGATVSERVVSEVGSLLDHEMIGEALLAGHLAELADMAGVSSNALSRRLMEITARSGVGELWIADHNGMLRAGSADDVDPSQTVASVAGLPRGSLARLLGDHVFSQALGIGRRPLGGEPMRYVGVSDPGLSNIVLVGREQSDITRLQRSLGVQRLLDALLKGGSVDAVWVFGPNGTPVASSVSQNQQADSVALEPRETHLVADVLGGAPSEAIVSSHWISVAAAIPDEYGVPAGVALARLSTAPLRGLIAGYLRIGGLAAAAALLAGLALSVVTGRRIAAPMMQIAGAAAAVDLRRFEPGSLRSVAARRDELGHLARTFEVMAEQVMAREEELERQVRERTAELRLRNEQLEEARRRLEADLELARLLQSTILPQRFPADRGWSGTARMVPALQMAGDFYDYFPIDAHRLGLVIADVSGKGVAPAFFMAVSRSALQEAARHHQDPGECLTAANDRLCEQNPLDMFVTVFYAVIDARSGAVSYANGGHNRPYVVAQDGALTAIPLTGGTMLGVMPGLPYDSATLLLQPGDTLFLYTDGVTEAMNQAGELFGEPRLEAALQDSAQHPVDEVLGHVNDAVRGFAGDAPQSDDITCLVVRFLGDRIEYAPQKPAAS